MAKQRAQLRVSKGADKKRLPPKAEAQGREEAADRARTNPCGTAVTPELVRELIERDRRVLEELAKL